MKQAEYFNCSSYRKNLKRTCTSHQITVKAITAIIQDDLKRTIHFAKNHNEEFLQTLRKDAEAKTKKELKENLREIETSEERIDKLDKIIESLYWTIVKEIDRKKRKERTILKKSFLWVGVLLCSRKEIMFKLVRG